MSICIHVPVICNHGPQPLWGNQARVIIVPAVQGKCQVSFYIGIIGQYNAN